MNPLRVLGDWLAPARLPPPVLSERERLMRHTGRPECPIREHADALRLLGRAIQDRDYALDALELLVTSRNAWRARALNAEAKLRHPCTGDQAA